VQENPGQAAAEEMTASAELLEHGGKVYKRCKSCHSLEPGKHGTGPSLVGVFGREAGTAEGYKYSDAMLESKVVWSAETLDQHLADGPGFTAQIFRVDLVP
jgi:cytochrome c